MKNENESEFKVKPLHVLGVFIGGVVGENENENDINLAVLAYPFRKKKRKKMKKKMMMKKNKIVIFLRLFWSRYNIHTDLAVSLVHSTVYRFSKPRQHNLDYI